MPPFKNTAGLRNRYRVTNKSRLRIIKDTLDAENVVVDEDEERARVVSTAGVDAEDANEHHLQAVLSAASHRTYLAQKNGRCSPDKSTEHGTSAAYIPVPDAAGVVDNYAELYPPDRWREPANYLKFSETIDECVSWAIADGFSYFMDERDKDWLEKNNQDARGEGTSSQASLSASGTTTRSSNRSAKSKGKEPDLTLPAAMTEDEFELVMGIFEKTTHDNTPFLHVSLQQGMTMPPFTNYHDFFASPLPPSLFATFMVPRDIPNAQNLVHMARTVYAYWRDRRAEREGHRIIPSLNFDESDVKNESYVCFRRRDVKAIRKTRTAQASPSEKLLRLKGELAAALDLASQTLHRELQKRDAMRHAQRTWEKRMVVADLKRKFPAFGSKEDEELLFDKERVPKRPRLSETPNMVRIKKAQDASASPVPMEPHIRPKDRTNMIQNVIEETLRRQKERDHHWDDMLDNPYQPAVIPWTQQLFKNISISTSAKESRRTARPMRLRVGRGGRFHFDRRSEVPPSRYALEHYLRHKAVFPEREDGLEKVEADERAWRIADRWKFDLYPPAAVDSSSEDYDRVLVDDFQPKYIRQSLSLVQDQDQYYFHTDARPVAAETLTGMNINLTSPFRPNLAQIAQMKRDLTSMQRSTLNVGSAPTIQAPQVHSNGPVQHSPPSATVPSMPSQTPIRKMAPPNAAMQQMRMPSNEMFRASSSSLAGAVTMPVSQPVNAPNGSTNVTNGGVTVPIPQVMLNGQASDATEPFNNETQQQQIQQQSNMMVDGVDASLGLPPRPKSQNQQNGNVHMQVASSFPHSVPNGAFNGYNNGLTNLPNGLPNAYLNHVTGLQHAQLTLQQAQTLKVAFSNPQQNQSLPVQATLAQAQRAATGYSAQLPNGLAGTNGMVGSNVSGLNMLPAVSMNLKLPMARQMQSMQWAASNGVAVQRPLSAANSDMLQSPIMNHALPNRAPSANGFMGSPVRQAQVQSQSPPNHHHYLERGGMQPVNGHHYGHNGGAQSLSPPHMGSPAQVMRSPGQMHASPLIPMQSPGPSPTPQHQVVSMNGVQAGFS